jgi:hypothetical protein
VDAKPVREEILLRSPEADPDDLSVRGPNFRRQGRDLLALVGPERRNAKAGHGKRGISGAQRAKEERRDLFACPPDEVVADSPRGTSRTKLEESICRRQPPSCATPRPHKQRDWRSIRHDQIAAVQELAIAWNLSRGDGRMRGEEVNDVRATAGHESVDVFDELRPVEDVEANRVDVDDVAMLRAGEARPPPGEPADRPRQGWFHRSAPNQTQAPG